METGSQQALAASGGRSATAERILDAAEELFAQRGFAGTAVRDIAAKVSLNPASLYNHFPGKRELYEAVLERGLRPIFNLLEDLASSKWEPGRDEQTVDSITVYLAGKPFLAKLIQHEVLTGGENFTRLAGRWVEPLYARGLKALRRTPGMEGWEEEELPLLLLSFHNLVVGYFSMASLMERMFGDDPLAAAAIERQRRFLRKVTQRLLGPPSSRPAGKRSAKGDARQGERRKRKR